MLKLKLQYFGHLKRRADSFERADSFPDAGKDWRQEEKGTTEDEMVREHHWLNGHEFEQAPGGKPGMLQSVGSQRVRHDWAAEQESYVILRAYNSEEKWDLTFHLPFSNHIDIELVFYAGATCPFVN